MQEDKGMSTIDSKQKSMLNQFTRIYQLVEICCKQTFNCQLCNRLKFMHAINLNFALKKSRFIFLYVNITEINKSQEMENCSLNENCRV